MHTCVVLNIHLIAFGVLLLLWYWQFKYSLILTLWHLQWPFDSHEFPWSKLNVHVRFAVQRFVHKYRLNNALCLCKATTSRIYCCPRIKTQFELSQRTPHCVVCCGACKCIFKQLCICCIFLSFKSQKPDFTQIKYTFSFASGEKKKTNNRNMCCRRFSTNFKKSNFIISTKTKKIQCDLLNFQVIWQPYSIHGRSVQFKLIRKSFSNKFKWFSMFICK